MKSAFWRADDYDCNGTNKNPQMFFNIILKKPDLTRLFCFSNNFFFENFFFSQMGLLFSSFPSMKPHQTYPFHDRCIVGQKRQSDFFDFFDFFCEF